MRQRVRFEIDVAEFDHAGTGGADQPAALPVDPGVPDRARGCVRKETNDTSVARDVEMRYHSEVDS